MFAQSAVHNAPRPDAFGLTGAVMAFAAGEEIYAQDEEADLVYRVVAGAVRTIRLSPDGRRQVGDFYYPGDLFGLEAGAVHRFAAEALGPCQIQLVRKGGEATQRLLNEAIAHELERTREHLLLLGRRTAYEKVASFLLDLADRNPEGHCTVLPMGRQDMADYLGLTIETVSRMLTQLQAEGLVAFEGLRRFRLKRAALMRRVEA